MVVVAVLLLLFVLVLVLLAANACTSGAAAPLSICATLRGRAWAGHVGRFHGEGRGRR